MTLQSVSLDDKYTENGGRVHVTGTQALVRLSMAQKWSDTANGLDTAGFVTGYRGSPLGGVDKAFSAAHKFTSAADINFQPGLNEDIAATAIAGTQQINLVENASKQGVFAMWYGKGPGVDRSGDAFRHGNLAGSAPFGGVLVLAGDDHTCKSSTTSHQSEYALMDAMIPTLNPAGVGEILEFGLLGFAMSRYSGCWSSLKLTGDTVDSSALISTKQNSAQLNLPDDQELPPGGLSIRWPDTPQQQEQRLHAFKIPAAIAFARANAFNRMTLGGKRRRLGIVTTGKSYLDVLQALEMLAIDREKAVELGLAIYKVGMVWPLEPEGIKNFAHGLDELLVVEEKRPLLEGQIKDVLYSMPVGQRPRIFGKRDDENRIVLPAHDDLNSGQIAKVLGARLLPLLSDDGLTKIIGDLMEANTSGLTQISPVQRTPYFCSGCPHNSSTHVPEGSRGMAGIGCHYMALNMDRKTSTHTQMGGEGANWIGQSSYVPTKHIFQNMGDGTYFHSGHLAVRAAIAAKVNITYKILFNDAVAMTGGQEHDGNLSPQRIAHQMRAEGVERIAIVSDDIDKYAEQESFPGRSTINTRDDLDVVQRELRNVPGVSVLIYDQVCAAEKRRRIKRVGTPTLERRLLINELVCEGCGDCSRESNCLSVTPIETEFGRKRCISQSSCNKDYSCAKGFCPSFVSIEGGKLRSGGTPDIDTLASIPVPEPAPIQLTHPWNVLVTGVGGTGIITIGAILATAAHIDGKGCSTLDMTGMAQKGGPVTTHLRIADHQEQLNSVRISAGLADLVLGCDIVVTTGNESLGVIANGHTKVLVNNEETITSDFVRNPNFSFSALELIHLLRDVAGSTNVESVAATKHALALLGDSIATNFFMVGFAYQRGLIPLSSEAIRRAIELNGVSVAMNRTAFRLGRLTAHKPSTIDGAGKHQITSARPHRTISTSLDEMISRRVDFLIDYQNSRYASEYFSYVAKARAKELSVMQAEGRFSEAVARSLFRLMSYKDEYEVARLYSGADFRTQIAEMYEECGRITFHLAPPMLTCRDSDGGVPRKLAFGPWMFSVFSVISKLKGLRGTAFDLFGYTVERRMERSLVEEYRASVDRTIDVMRPETFDTAVAIASIADEISGFGHVKSESVRVARQRWEELEATLK